MRAPSASSGAAGSSLAAPAYPSLPRARSALARCDSPLTRARCVSAHAHARAPQGVVTSRPLPAYHQTSFRRSRGTSRCRVAARAASPGPSVVTTVPSTPSISARVQRLESLVQLRKLYRNLLRAEVLLGLESPVYVPPPPPPAGQTEASDVAEGASKEEGAPPLLSEAEAEELERETEERTQEALKLLADMALTGAQIKVQFQELPRGYDELLSAPQREAKEDKRSEPGKTVEAVVADRVTSTCALLSARIKREIAALPISASAARSEVRRLNARFTRPSSSGAGAFIDETEDDESDRLQTGAGSTSSEDGKPESVSGSESGAPSPLAERLEQTERRIERFVARRVTPAMRAAQREGARAVLSSAAEYTTGLWDRLNGGGGSGGRGPALPPDLPLPESTRADCAPLVERAIVDADRLEKRLQEASTLRERKLRSAGLKGRTELAITLPRLDAEVLLLSRELALTTLELQMLYIYMALEDEALDILDGPTSGRLPLRTGSSEELGLYVAEFSLLDEALSVLSAFIEKEGSSAFNAFDEELSRLAEEVPDLRFRLGIKDGEVYARAAGLARAQLEFRDSVDETWGKVLEGVEFFRRGMSLLGSDVSTSTALFMKAALGTPLRRRETMALRRTLRDLFTFVPFTAILIIPLSPVGHVLVFGFIQRYFPEYFPSQFTSRRQEIMARYDELREQLAAARREAEAMGDAEDLRRAAEAVARVTAVTSSQDPTAVAEDEDDASLAAVKKLELQTARTLREAFESDLEDEPER